VARRVAIGIFWSALILVGIPIPPAAHAQTATATVEFLDVGQGDATLIRSPEGKFALVDAGPGRGIVPLLRERGVTAIDLAVVSHHHADHYGGMADVVRAFRPRMFLASGSAHTTGRYLELLKLVRDEGIPAIGPNRDGTPRKVELGSVVLTVLPQPPEDPDEENNNSVGLRVQYGDAAVLLTGDSEDDERRFWRADPAAARLCAGCDVLKLAHHGSRNGTDDAWLDLVRPGLAVASCGAGNPFGHPHPETLARLAARRIPLRRTDRDGPVLVVGDGRRWGVADRRPPDLLRLRLLPPRPPGP
jgi:competence protein ComEC